MKIFLRCFSCCCRAFLPPKHNPVFDDYSHDNRDPADDDDYYKRLGVESNATFDDIRKAYKKRSLQLHPDKIAQRGDADGHDEFQRLREAYEVISDPRKRDLYDVLGPEAMTYLLDTSQVDATTVMKNFQTASCFNKSKVYLYGLLLIGLILLLPILICLEVENILPLPWYLVGVPLWILNLIILPILIYRVERSLKRKSRCFHQAMDVVKFVCIIAAQVFLALKWDGIIPWPYLYVFAPLYACELARLYQAVVLATSATWRIGKMITLPYIENMFGKPYTDLTDEERAQVNKEYIIVHPAVTDMDAEQNEEFHLEMLESQIKKSPEYIKASTKLRTAYSMIWSVALHGCLLGLLVPQLDVEEFEVSWWLIFTPVWVGAFVSCCFSCYQLGKVFMPESDVVMVYQQKNEPRKSSTKIPPEQAFDSRRTDDGRQDSVGSDNGRDVENQLEQRQVELPVQMAKNKGMGVDVSGSFASESEVELCLSPMEFSECSSKLFKAQHSPPNHPASSSHSPSSVKRIIVGSMQVSPGPSDMVSVSSNKVVLPSPSISRDGSASEKDIHVKQSLSKITPVNSGEGSFDTRTELPEVMDEALHKSFGTYHTSKEFDEASVSSKKSSRSNKSNKSFRTPESSKKSINDKEGNLLTTNGNDDGTPFRSPERLIRQLSAGSSQFNSAESISSFRTSNTSLPNDDLNQQPLGAEPNYVIPTANLMSALEKASQMSGIHQFGDDPSSLHSPGLGGAIAQDRVLHVSNHPSDKGVQSPESTPPWVAHLEQQQQKQQQLQSRQLDNVMYADSSDEEDSITGGNNKEMPNGYDFQQKDTDDYDLMEAASQALGNCCTVAFYVTMTCLFVGRLEGGEDGSYSSFWIIFPLLLPAGMFLCCFTCAVYCTPDIDSLDDDAIHLDDDGAFHPDDVRAGETAGQNNHYNDHKSETSSVMSAKEKALELISVSSFSSRVSRFSSLD